MQICYFKVFGLNIFDDLHSNLSTFSQPNPACRRPGLQPEGKRREKAKKPHKIKLVEKLEPPGREVELSSKVLGSNVQGQSRRAPKANVRFLVSD